MGREYTRREFILLCLELFSVVVVESGMTLYDLYHTRRELKILQLSSHLDMQMSSSAIRLQATISIFLIASCTSWAIRLQASSGAINLPLTTFSELLTRSISRSVHGYKNLYSVNKGNYGQTLEIRYTDLIFDYTFMIVHILSKIGQNL